MRKKAPLKPSAFRLPKETEKKLRRIKKHKRLPTRTAAVLMAIDQFAETLPHEEDALAAAR